MMDDTLGKISRSPFFRVGAVGATVLKDVSFKI